MSVIVLSLVVGVLAVARLSRLLTTDRLTIGYRRWVVNKWGADSMPSYLAHCDWCTSMWLAVPIMPVAALYPFTWVIGILAVPAASLVAGLILSEE